MAIDKKKVDEQLSKIGDFDQWFTKKEIKYLPEVLNEDEIIYAITSGLYDGTTWLVVATQKRILFLDKGMFYGLKQVELPIEQISAISHKTGLFFGEIQIATAGGNKKIEMISKKDVLKVADIISKLISQKYNNNQSSGRTTDIASQLEKLVKLKEQGVLTDEEFTKLKQKILNQ